jgi:threonine/homoserine/homoserine lactone efflux protein
VASEASKPASPRSSCLQGVVTNVLNPNVRTLLDRATGVLFLVLSVRLAWSRQL